jgi:hydrogenase/urease accessory protein HupE
MTRVMPAGLLALLALLAAPPAAAHPLAPLLLEVREAEDGRVEVAWKTPLLMPRGAAPAPVLPARCRALGPPTTAAAPAGLRAHWEAACGPGGLAGERLGVEGLAEPLLALVRVRLADGRLLERVLTPSAPALTIPARAGGGAVLRDYLALGVRHILAGPDHLLFVFGLVLLAATPRRLLGTVTAFTAGHSVTLSLAALGLTRFPAGPIEVAIAASVLALAIELAREPPRPTAMRRRPWATAMAFGLLHGLGFAAALHEAGLPAEAVPLALFAFNAGIEIGQVAFVLVLLAAGRALRIRRARPAGWARRIPVYAMGSLAAFWCFERAAALLR